MKNKRIHEWEKYIDMKLLEYINQFTESIKGILARAEQGVIEKNERIKVAGYEVQAKVTHHDHELEVLRKRVEDLEKGYTAIMNFPEHSKYRGK